MERSHLSNLVLLEADLLLLRPLGAMFTCTGFLSGFQWLLLVRPTLRPSASLLIASRARCRHAGWARQAPVLAGLQRVAMAPAGPWWIDDRPFRSDAPLQGAWPKVFQQLEHRRHSTIASRSPPSWTAPTLGDGAASVQLVPPPIKKPDRHLPGPEEGPSRSRSLFRSRLVAPSGSRQ